MKKNKMKIICKRENCKYCWEYGGESKDLVTCPRCLIKNKIPKSK